MTPLEQATDKALHDLGAIEEQIDAWLDFRSVTEGEKMRHAAVKERLIQIRERLAAARQMNGTNVVAHPGFGGDPRAKSIR